MRPLSPQGPPPDWGDFLSSCGRCARDAARSCPGEIFRILLQQIAQGAAQNCGVRFCKFIKGHVTQSNLCVQEQEVNLGLFGRSGSRPLACARGGSAFKDGFKILPELCTHVFRDLSTISSTDGCF
eukprot:jgi/Botrbrau1/14123/Bobra.182_3s0066.1